MSAELQTDMTDRKGGSLETEIVTDSQTITDYLAQPLPLSNLERQWAFRERVKWTKAYGCCRFCGGMLLRKVKGVDVREWSPTNDPLRAFCCHECKESFFLESTGQYVLMMQREDVGIKRNGAVGQKSIVRPTVVWVGFECGGGGDVLTVERPEVKPRPVHHQVDHTNWCSQCNHYVAQNHGHPMDAPTIVSSEQKKTLAADGERNFIGVELSIAVAKRTRRVNGRENPSAEFISRVLDLAETPYGLVSREWVDEQMRMGSQAISRCRNHRPPDCACWAASRASLWQASASGEKTPEAWAAARAYEFLA
jgi:hypothetical protein